MDYYFHLKHQKIIIELLLFAICLKESPPNANAENYDQLSEKSAGKMKKDLEK